MRLASRLAVLFLAANALAAAPAAHASDFWDLVREPGLAAYRRSLVEARLAMHAHRYTDAARAAADARDAFAGDAEAEVILGLALGELGRHGESAAAFERALAISPTSLDDPTHGGRAAELLAIGGAYALSSRVLARVLAQLGPGPRRAMLFRLWGDVASALPAPDLVTAERAYREALREGLDDDSRTLLGLAVTLDRAGERRLAAETAAKAIGADDPERAMQAAPLPPRERLLRLAWWNEAQGQLGRARELRAEATSGAP